MLRLRKLILRRVNGERSFFKMNSGMEGTSQIFLCESGSRRRPMSARDGNFTNIDYETQVLNVVDKIVQDSQRKGIKHAAMLQQPTFMQHRSRSWTAAAQADKTPSENRGGITREVRSFEGISGYAYTKHCNTTPGKCVCGRIDGAPPSFLASQRTSISPKKRRGWGDVLSSFRERAYSGNSRRSTPSPMRESPRSDRGSLASYVRSSLPTRLHSARHPVPCCSTPQRQVRPSSPPSYAALLAAIASASPLRTRPRSRSQSAARRPSSRSRTRGSPDGHISFAAVHEAHSSSRQQTPPLSQRSFHSRSVDLQEGSASLTL